MTEGMPAPAAAAEGPLVPSLVDRVQLDGLVVLKVVKHCQESFPLTVTGQLLGMDMDGCLEITNAYPFPQVTTSSLLPREHDRNEEIDQSQYQMNMMRCVREVNIDHQVVGWYQSSGSQMGSFLTIQWLETQFSYQDNLRNVVCLVYDPVRTENGSLSIKAFRLSERFMQMRKRGDFSSLGFSRARVDSSQIIEELPVSYTMSSVQKAFLVDLSGRKEFARDNPVDMTRLSLPDTPTVEQSMEFMVNDMEELNREQNRYSYFLRSNSARLQGTYQELLRKKKAAKGGAPYNPADEEQLSSILSAETSRLESKMLIKEISACTSILTTLSSENLVSESSIGALQPNH